MMRPRLVTAPTAALVLCLSTSACAGPGPDDREEFTELVTRLVHSEPEAWIDTAPAVLAHGKAIAPALIDAIQADRGAAGEQVALGVLGALPHPRTGPFLLSVLRERSDNSAEAALALGRLGFAAASPSLRSIIADAEADTVLRTAAAAASLDLGCTEAALPFLRAILLAGTPAGLATMATHGLADKSRWALERHIAIAAIERHTGKTFGLDPDLAWPDLASRTATAFDAMQGEAR